MDRRFENLRLIFKRTSSASGLRTLILGDKLPCDKGEKQEQHHIDNVGNYRAIPRRQDSKSKLTFRADLVTASTRADSEAVVSRTKTAVVRLFLIGPVGPSVICSIQAILIRCVT